MMALCATSIVASSCHTDKHTEVQTQLKLIEQLEQVEGQ
jgi:hypothetical protein